jgi:hypothetical protein
MAGAGIEELCDWLITRTGATPEVIGVAIEMTQGPVVEALLERGFCVYGINLKQLDRFHDRFTVAELADDLAADWFLDLWNQAPTPAKAVRLRETTIERPPSPRSQPPMSIVSFWR